MALLQVPTPYAPVRTNRARRDRSSAPGITLPLAALLMASGSAGHALAQHSPPALRMQELARWSLPEPFQSSGGWVGSGAAAVWDGTANVVYIADVGGPLHRVPLGRPAHVAVAALGTRGALDIGLVDSATRREFSVVRCSATTCVQSAPPMRLARRVTQAVASGRRWLLFSGDPRTPGDTVAVVITVQCAADCRVASEQAVRTLTNGAVADARFVVSAQGDDVTLTQGMEPYRVFVLDAARDALRVSNVFAPPADAVARAGTAADAAVRRWRPIRTLRVGDSYVQQISDLASDDRVLVRYPAVGGGTARVSVVRAPIGFLAGDAAGLTLLAVRTTDVRELVVYAHAPRQRGGG